MRHGMRDLDEILGQIKAHVFAVLGDVAVRVPRGAFGIVAALATLERRINEAGADGFLAILHRNDGVAGLGLQREWVEHVRQAALAQRIFQDEVRVDFGNVIPGRAVAGFANNALFRLDRRGLALLGPIVSGGVALEAFAAGLRVGDAKLGGNGFSGRVAEHIESLGVRTGLPFVKLVADSFAFVAQRAIDRVELLGLGLDRVLDFEFTAKRFDYPHNLDVNAIFKNCFGVINLEDKEPENVVLSFKPEQGKYIKSYPLHESQTIISDDKHGLVIKLHIWITHDLVMEILSYGDTVKVVSPVRLGKQVRKIYATALDQYE